MASGAHLDLAKFDTQGLSNSLKNDIVFHTIYSSQKIHLASGSNVEANLTITSNNIGIKTINPVSSLDIGTTHSIKVPVGTTAQRPTLPYPGMIRYNTDLLQFEGYTENSWVGMEGIKDVDGNTYIQPENYPGANNNQLKFYTNNTLSMTVDSNQNVGIGTTIPYYTLDVTGNISGSIIRTPNIITPSVFIGNSNNIFNAFTENTNNLGDLYYSHGNIGLGTTNPQGILDIKGKFIANTIEYFEYPPLAMTSDSTVLSDGTYKSSCSSNYTASYPAWKVFDKIISDSNDAWIGTSNAYYGSNGLQLRNIVTSNIDGKSSNLGDWIQLQTPYNILVSKYKIYNRYNYSYQAPVNFNLLGSSNSTTWTTIDSQTNHYWHKNNSNNAYVNLDDALTFYTFNNSNYYNYYRLSINKIAENAVSSGGSNNFSSNVAIGEIKFYGQQQYSTSINTSNLVSIYTIDNNIGIGTTNPLGRLQINNINGMEDTLILANGGNSNEFHKTQITFGYSNSTDYAHYIGTRHDKGYSSNNAIDFYCCNSNQKNSIIWGSTPVMSLLGNGNVGIGTTNPLTLLHVNGSLTINNNVGIGITTPSTLLHVNGSLTMNSTNNFITFGTSSSLGSPGTLSGTKLVLYGTGSSTNDYSMGMNSGMIWYNVYPNARHSFCIAGTESTYITSSLLNCPSLYINGNKQPNIETSPVTFSQNLGYIGGAIETNLIYTTIARGTSATIYLTCYGTISTGNSIGGQATIRIYMKTTTGKQFIGSTNTCAITPVVNATTLTWSVSPTQTISGLTYGTSYDITLCLVAVNDTGLAVNITGCYFITINYL